MQMQACQNPTNVPLVRVPQFLLYYVEVIWDILQGSWEVAGTSRAWDKGIQASLSSRAPSLKNTWTNAKLNERTDQERALPSCTSCTWPGIMAQSIRTSNCQSHCNRQVQKCFQGQASKVSLCSTRKYVELRLCSFPHTSGQELDKRLLCHVGLYLQRPVT